MELLIGVCGGVSAFKTASLVSRLAQKGFGLTVVMTDSAQKFVGPATFSALSGREVLTNSFDLDGHPLGPHIEVARRAELFCIAPTTANLLSKAASGQADDLLSTLLLSFTGPILLAPAMNAEMWEKRVVQRNVETVKADGMHVIQPGSGWLSCRDQGAGRMAEPDQIFETIRETLSIDTI